MSSAACSTRRSPSSQGLEATSEPHDGHAAVLAEHAREADLLVTGSRGYGPLGRVLMGSTAAPLGRISPCPLLVVPRGQSGDR